MQTDSHVNDNSESQHTSGDEPVLPSSAGCITTKSDCFVRETELGEENIQHPTQNGQMENEQNVKTPRSDDEKDNRQMVEIAPGATQLLMELVDAATKRACMCPSSANYLLTAFI